MIDAPLKKRNLETLNFIYHPDFLKKYYESRRVVKIFFVHIGLNGRHLL